LKYYLQLTVVTTKRLSRRRIIIRVNLINSFQLQAIYGLRYIPFISFPFSKFRVRSLTVIAKWNRQVDIDNHTHTHCDSSTNMPTRKDVSLDLFTSTVCYCNTQIPKYLGLWSSHPLSIVFLTTTSTFLHCFHCSQFLSTATAKSSSYKHRTSSVFNSDTSSQPCR
jgi:hypothetical protein